MQTIQEMARRYNLGRIAEDLAHISLPCLDCKLVRVKEDDEQPIGVSRVGGMPDLPSNFDWPRWRDTPLSFLMQVNLADLAAFAIANDFPASGFLWFFYDPEQRTWGFDPTDRGSWKVVYRAVAPSQLARCAPPPDAVVLGLTDSMPNGSDRFLKSATFLPCMVHFAEEQSFPAFDEAVLTPLQLSNEEEDNYCNLATRDRRHVQMFGYPAPEQASGMRLECQLAANGVYVGDGLWREHPAIAWHEIEATHWHLLLQLDSYNESGMNWGSEGKIYFWIHHGDLLTRNFGNVWMILQCS
jgi:uncharacterized protein YwqG